MEIKEYSVEDNVRRQYLENMERKVVEQSNTIDILNKKIVSLRETQEKLIKSLEKHQNYEQLRILWAKGEIEETVSGFKKAAKEIKKAASTWKESRDKYFNYK